MAQYRQSGPDRLTNHHHYSSNGGPTTSPLHLIPICVPSIMTHKLPRHHRRSKSSSYPRISISSFLTFFFFFLLASSALVFLFLSSRHHSDVVDSSDVQDDDFLTNVTRITTSQVKYGSGSVTHGRDSRYWDGDDRRRDEDYNEDVVHERNESNDDTLGKSHFHGKGKSLLKKSDDSKDSSNHGLYNEAGRNELKMYEEKYEASLKSVSQLDEQTDEGNHVVDHGNLDLENEELDTEDEYDDDIDPQDAHLHYDNARHKNEANSAVSNSYVEVGVNNITKGHNTHKVPFEGSSQDSSSKSYNVDNPDDELKHARVADGQSKTGSEKRSKKPSRHRKSSSRCEMKLLESAAQLVEPLESRKFARFSLMYAQKEVKADGVDDWEPRFSGHQSLREREDSFLARDQKINCGFIKGPAGYPSTGFDLAVDDVRYISKCHIAVISGIFGNSDRLRSPFIKLVSRLSRKNVCFVMFMDEATLHTLSSEGQIPDRMGFIGLWRVVVVKNLPYSDMRRVGKIPKLLSHRLFPSARYSIWLDSKLRLQQDPLLLLEYFLWRKGHEYAISNHYDRHCVWEEVERNKKLNKFNHTMIDQQFAFYQADGLKRFNASDPNKLLSSNVPEGSLIIRAHTPMSNLFSCLWFNEVDRFTPRDQLSFAYTYHKLRKKNPDKPFYLHMFKDCERRKIAKLFHHRTEEKRMAATHGVV